MFRKIIEFINKHRSYMYYDPKSDSLIAEYLFLKNKILIKTTYHDDGYTVLYYPAIYNDPFVFFIKDPDTGYMHHFTEEMVRYFLTHESYRYYPDNTAWYKLLWEKYKHCVEHPELYPLRKQGMYTFDGAYFANQYESRKLRTQY